MKDIQNKEEYAVKSLGLSYAHYGNSKEQSEKANTAGLLPSLTPGAANTSSSVTNSAISPGTITVTKEPVDVSKLNRDTQHARNTLQKTVDKQTINEKQALSQMFLKNADKLLHHYERDGKLDKAVAHGLAAEFASRLAGNPAGSGFYAGFANELLIQKTTESAGNNPAKAQWISAALGASVNAVTGGTIQTGAMAAQYGMQWNKYEKIPEIEAKIKQYKKSEVYKKLDNNEYLVIPSQQGSVGVVIDNRGNVIDLDRIIGRGHSRFYYTKKITANGHSFTIATVQNYKTDHEIKTGEKVTYVTGEYDGNITDTNFFYRNKKEFSVGESTAKNLTQKVMNMTFDGIEYRKWGGKALKNVNRVGGPISVGLTINEIGNDAEKYDGGDFVIAVISDLAPTAMGVAFGFLGSAAGVAMGGGVAGGIVGGNVGGIVGGIIGDDFKNWIRNRYLYT